MVDTYTVALWSLTWPNYEVKFENSYLGLRFYWREKEKSLYKQDKFQ